MALKASDMPHEVKRRMLERLESQLGSTEYDKLVNTLGEDGLIDLALKELNSASTGRSSSNGGSDAWSKAWAVVLWIIGSNWPVILCFFIGGCVEVGVLRTIFVSVSILFGVYLASGFYFVIKDFFSNLTRY